MRLGTTFDGLNMLAGLAGGSTPQGTCAGPVAQTLPVSNVALRPLFSSGPVQPNMALTTGPSNQYSAAPTACALAPSGKPIQTGGAAHSMSVSGSAAQEWMMPLALLPSPSPARNSDPNVSAIYAQYLYWAQLLQAYASQPTPGASHSMQGATQPLQDAKRSTQGSERSLNGAQSVPHPSPLTPPSSLCSPSGKELAATVLRTNAGNSVGSAQNPEMATRQWHTPPELPMTPAAATSEDTREAPNACAAAGHAPSASPCRERATSLSELSHRGLNSERMVPAGSPKSAKLWRARMRWSSEDMKRPAFSKIRAPPGLLNPAPDLTEPQYNRGVRFNEFFGKKDPGESMGDDCAPRTNFKASGPVQLQTKSQRPSKHGVSATYLDRSISPSTRAQRMAAQNAKSRSRFHVLQPKGRVGVLEEVPNKAWASAPRAPDFEDAATNTNAITEPRAGRNIEDDAESFKLTETFAASSSSPNFGDGLKGTVGQGGGPNSVHPVRLPSGRFKCSQCDKTFKYAKLVLRHGANHLEEREFECKLCCSSFTRSDLLARHLERCEADFEGDARSIGQRSRRKVADRKTGRKPPAPMKVVGPSRKMH